MIKIIPTLTSFPDVKRANEVKPNEIIVAKLNDSKFILTHEPNGYIFKNASDAQYGHSGHSATPVQSIEHALAMVPGTVIYSVKNYFEAAKFLLS